MWLTVDLYYWSFEIIVPEVGEYHFTIPKSDDLLRLSQGLEKRWIGSFEVPPELFQALIQEIVSDLSLQKAGGLVL